MVAQPFPTAATSLGLSHSTDNQVSDSIVNFRTVPDTAKNLTDDEESLGHLSISLATH